MDEAHDKSLVAEATRPGLIVLCSPGKFFGLAGGVLVCQKEKGDWLHLEQALAAAMTKDIKGRVNSQEKIKWVPT